MRFMHTKVQISFEARGRYAYRTRNTMYMLIRLTFTYGIYNDE